MDHTSNSNPNGTHCQSNKHDNQDLFTLKTCLRLTEGRRDVSERNAAKHDRLKAEVNDLQFQLDDLLKTLDDTNTCYKQTYNDVTGDLEEMSFKYNETLSKIDELEQKNQDLQCNIQSNTSKEIQMVDKIYKMECLNFKNLEYNNQLQDKINNEKECQMSLNRQLCNLEDVNAGKTAEAKTLRCVLTDREAAARCQNQKLTKIQQQNADSDGTVEKLTVEYQNRKAELDALVKASQEQLARIDQSMDGTQQELANTIIDATEWKARGEKVAKMFSELRKASEAELCCKRSVLMDHESERIRLTEQLLDTSGQLKCSVNQNCRLMADSKAVAELVANLVAEVERLEQRKFHDRLALEVQRTTFESETVLHEDVKTVKQKTLTAINNEVDALRRACEIRERAIGDAKRKLYNNNC